MHLPLHLRHHSGELFTCRSELFTGRSLLALDGLKACQLVCAVATWLRMRHEALTCLCGSLSPAARMDAVAPALPSGAVDYEVGKLQRVFWALDGGGALSWSHGGALDGHPFWSAGICVRSCGF